MDIRNYTVGDYVKFKIRYLESEDKMIGCQSYVIDKARLSIRLTAPYSEERCKAASELVRLSYRNHFHFSNYRERSDQSVFT